MAAINKHDLWDELDATDEAFVRQKHAKGGYGPARQRLVGQWLASKDAAMQATKAAVMEQSVRQTAFWTRAAACAAWAAAFATIVALFK